MKAVVGAFNQKKALVGAFSVIANLRMDLIEAQVVTVTDFSAVKRSIGFTISFHNQGECPY